MIEIYEASDGWRWRVMGKNGEVIAVGEAYASRYNAYRSLGRLEAILISTDEVTEIPLKRKHDMEYADEQRGLEIRSPHSDRGLL